MLTPTLDALPAFLANCDALLGLDSGAVHVAATVGVPTVVFFGPQDPALTKPISPRSRVIIKEGFFLPHIRSKIMCPSDGYMHGRYRRRYRVWRAELARSKGVSAIPGLETEDLNRTSGRAQ